MSLPGDLALGGGGGAAPGAIRKKPKARKRGARTLEPTLAAENAWVDEVVKAAIGRQTYLAECTPGYYNNEGVFDPVAARNSQYWRGPVAFLRLLDKWRKDGNLEGLELTSEDGCSVPAQTA